MDELASLDQSSRESALERFRIIQPCLERDRSLSLVAKEAGIPYRTIHRWMSRYRRFGLLGLARKAREDRGKRRALPARLLEIAEALALETPPIPIAAIYRRICQVAQDIGSMSPSYDVVYEVVRQLPTGLLTLAHGGDKAYSAAFDLVHRREAERPNEIWQADHTLLDILVQRDGKKPGRPWLTVVEDDYSRAVAGYFLFFDAPSVIQTALALHQAIWRKADPHWHICGIPNVLYTDNGRDFTSKHLEQVAVDLKIQLVFSTPGVPRGRGRVERFFSTISTMLLCDLPGFKSPPGKAATKELLTLAELDKLLGEFLLGKYHQRIHSETKMAPAERWEKGAFLPRMPESIEQLDLLLLTVLKTRKVRNDGIHFMGMRYVDPTLAAYVAESVTLRYDPRDMAEIRVFHQQRFLCRAICPELAGATVPIREITQARNKHRHDLQNLIRDRRRTVEELLEMKRGNARIDKELDEKAPPTKRITLKRYYNEEHQDLGVCGDT
jgi:putative transposase